MNQSITCSCGSVFVRRSDAQTHIEIYQSMPDAHTIVEEIPLPPEGGDLADIRDRQPIPLSSVFGFTPADPPTAPVADRGAELRALLEDLGRERVAALMEMLTEFAQRDRLIVDAEAARGRYEAARGRIEAIDRQTENVLRELIANLGTKAAT